MQFVSERNQMRVHAACWFSLIALVIIRALPFLIYPGIHFDSDQATFGLMAIHLSKLKNFPVFMYGQKYMLAVQAWLAAPLFLFLGPSILVLKISTLITNIIAVLCLFEFLRRKLQFSNRDAFILALPIATPSLALSQQWMNASGGHIEPIFYAILIYWLRDRNFLFPLVSALAVLHREYCLAAVLAAWIILYLERRHHASVKRKALGFLLLFAWVLAAVQFAARKFSTNFFGPSPPFKFNHGFPLFIDSAQWVGRHLALIWGASAQIDPTLALSFRDGNFAVGVALLTLFITALFTLRKIEFKRFAFGLYLFFISFLVCAFYLFKLQSHDGLGMRYLVMAGFFPLACGIWALSNSHRLLRVLTYAVLILTSIFHIYDVSHYEYVLNITQPVDINGDLASGLQRREIRNAIAPYWKAYDVSFRTGEKVRVASSEQIRIPEYQDDYALSAQALKIDDPDCLKDPRSFQIDKTWICPKK